MERFVKFACYCRRTRSDNAPTSPPSSSQVGPAADPSSSAVSALNVAAEASRQPRSQETEHGDGRTGDNTRPLWNFLQRVLSVENLFKSVQVFLTGNIVFMIFLMLHLRGLSMSSSILLLLTIWYNMILIIQIITNHHTMDFEVEMLFSKLEQLKQIMKKMLHNMGQLRDEQPGLVNSLFCIAACSVSVIMWLLDYMMNGMLLKYIFFMLILLISAVMIYLTIRRLSVRPPPSNRRESDSEIEEFLPAATETNIQILTKAGDVGEYSSTPTSALAESPKEHEEQEFLNDNDLAGHKMPSHEDGSSDGLELSDLELSEKSSTSSCSGQSDSEFEIIDQQEIGKLCTSQNTT